MLVCLLVPGGMPAVRCHCWDHSLQQEPRERSPHCCPGHRLPQVFGALELASFGCKSCTEYSTSWPEDHMSHTLCYGGHPGIPVCVPIFPCVKKGFRLSFAQPANEALRVFCVKASALTYRHAGQLHTCLFFSADTQGRPI